MQSCAGFQLRPSEFRPVFLCAFGIQRPFPCSFRTCGFAAPQDTTVGQQEKQHIEKVFFETMNSDKVGVPWVRAMSWGILWSFWLRWEMLIQLVNSWIMIETNPTLGNCSQTFDQLTVADATLF